MMVVLHDARGQAIGFEQDFVRHFTVNGSAVSIVLTDGREVSVQESPDEVASLISLSAEDTERREKQYAQRRWLHWPWRSSQKRIGRS